MYVVPRVPGSRLLVEVGSGVVMCLMTSDLAYLPRWTPTLPCVHDFGLRLFEGGVLMLSNVPHPPAGCEPQELRKTSPP
jgi:hypothetical protein